MTAKEIIRLARNQSDSIGDNSLNDTELFELLNLYLGDIVALSSSDFTLSYASEKIESITGDFLTLPGPSTIRIIQKKTYAGWYNIPLYDYSDEKTLQYKYEPGPPVGIRIIPTGEGPGEYRVVFIGKDSLTPSGMDEDIVPVDPTGAINEFLILKLAIEIYRRRGVSDSRVVGLQQRLFEVSERFKLYRNPTKTQALTWPDVQL